MVEATVGVLSLQGAFAQHRKVLGRLNVASKEVRYSGDLQGCDGLIIPGGESTTMTRLIDFIGMREPLLKFAEAKPVMGTCAGLILMAKRVDDQRVRTLDLLDIDVARNAYGRQVDSFRTSLDIPLPGKNVSLKGVFIRAPRIISTAGEVSVLGSLDREPIMVQQNCHLGCTFHPELSGSTEIHRYFVSLIKEPTYAE